MIAEITGRRPPLDLPIPVRIRFLSVFSVAFAKSGTLIPENDALDYRADILPIPFSGIRSVRSDSVGGDFENLWARVE